MDGRLRRLRLRVPRPLLSHGGEAPLPHLLARGHAADRGAADPGVSALALGLARRRRGGVTLSRAGAGEDERGVTRNLPLPFHRAPARPEQRPLAREERLIDRVELDVAAEVDDE